MPAFNTRYKIQGAISGKTVGWKQLTNEVDYGKKIDNDAMVWCPVQHKAPILAITLRMNAEQN